MTLHEQLWDLVEHTPEGVTTVTLDVDWLRRQLKVEGVPGAGEDKEGGGTCLTTSEAARRLSVEPETIARWCRDGRFPSAFKTDPAGETGEWRIPAEDVRRMQKNRKGADERVHFERN